MYRFSWFFFFFFFNDTATTEIYTLSLHDALPIYGRRRAFEIRSPPWRFLLPPRDESLQQLSSGRVWQSHGKSRWKAGFALRDRKSTRLNSSHLVISYAVFCLKKKKQAR